MNAPAFNATGLRSLELAGSTFYLRDGLMELWLAVIVDALAGKDVEWMHRLRDDLRYQATIVFDGLLAARLDAHLITEERLHEFVELCRRVRTELSEGHFALGPLAARLGAERWDTEMAPRLVRVTDAVLWLADQADGADHTCCLPAQRREIIGD
jgi:hypothetical protein